MVPWLAISFFILLIAGIPVAATMGLSSVIAMFNQDDIPLLIILQRMFGGLYSYPLLAIPFYMLAGTLMTEGGITQKLVDFANVLVGYIRGGLAYVNVLASLLFAGIQGSGTADCASLGVIEITAMVNAGYSKGYSCAVTAASACIGPIVPPSVMMIIYGSISGMSIGALFLAGFVPGVLMAIAMFITCAYKARHGEQGPMTTDKFSFRSVLHGLKEASIPLGMPLIIIGGILGGVFTPTEAGVVAAVYALVVGALVYRTLTLKGIYRAVVDTSMTVGMVGLILAFASTSNWILANAEVPTKIANYLMGVSTNPKIVLFLVIIMLYAVGCFMDIMASLLILVPILHPLGSKLGYDPLHWSIIVILVLCCGGITPPVGTHLFITTGIARGSLIDTYKAVLPFVAALFLVVLLVAYIPTLSLFIPRLFIY
jgi:C4-dicarboxylate transporter DctM subunit